MSGDYASSLCHYSWALSASGFCKNTDLSLLKQRQIEQGNTCCMIEPGLSQCQAEFQRKIAPTLAGSDIANPEMGVMKFLNDVMMTSVLLYYHIYLKPK